MLSDKPMGLQEGTQIREKGSYHYDPGLILPLPRENYDAILNAVSEYVSEGKITEEEYNNFCLSFTDCTPKNPFLRTVDPANHKQTGVIMSFETSDLQDRRIRSDVLFPGHKITMLNVWDTTCGACITEMPALKELSVELKEKGGQLVGLIYNADEADLIREAKEISDNLQLNYINLLPTEEIKSLLQVRSFPTTFFINERGEAVGEPILGAQIRQYRSRLEKYLAE